MAENITTGYKRLFEVRLLHHYWLDEGNSVFDSFDADKRNNKLLNYNCAGLFIIKPTPVTSAMMRVIKAIARQTGTGLVVTVPKNTVIPDDCFFTFTIDINEPSVFTIPHLPFKAGKLLNVIHRAMTKYTVIKKMYLFSQI